MIPTQGIPGGSDDQPKKVNHSEHITRVDEPIDKEESWITFLMRRIERNVSGGLPS